MANIVLKNYDGDDKTFEGVDRVKLNTVGGGTQIFSEGEVLEGLTLELDFADGDQIVTAPPGMLVKSATILKPDTLKPENIVKDVEIAGVIGSFAGGGVNMKSGTFTGNGGAVTVTHNLGEKPQLVIVFAQKSDTASGQISGGTRSVSMGAGISMCDALKQKLGWPYHRSAITPYSSTALHQIRYSGCMQTSSSQYVVYDVTQTTMKVGSSYTGTFKNVTYRWIAMSGLV